MRNARFGDVRPTSPLSARTVEIASEIGGVNHSLAAVYARARGVGEPLTSARAVEIASEIGVVLPVLWPAPRPRGGAARIGVSRPTRPSRRCAAPTERLAPAAADSMAGIRCAAADGARAIARRAQEGAGRRRFLCCTIVGRSSERWMRPRRG